METREQGSSGQVTSASKSGISLFDWQLLPGERCQLLKQRQNAIRLFFDGHLVEDIFLSQAEEVRLYQGGE